MYLKKTLIIFMILTFIFSCKVKSDKLKIKDSKNLKLNNKKDERNKINEEANYYYAILNNINMREKPNLNSKVITQINKDNKVIFLNERKKTKTDVKINNISMGNEWIKIKFNEKTGWVFKNFFYKKTKNTIFMNKSKLFIKIYNYIEDFEDTTNDKIIEINMNKCFLENTPPFEQYINRFININSNNEYDVYIKYDNEVLLLWEGTGIELDDWRHYISDWIKIKEIEKNIFLLGLTDNESNKFYKISNQELNDVYELYASKLFKNQETKNELKTKLTDIKESPFHIHTSKIYLKIINNEDKNENYEIEIKNNPYW